jgi:hypothetical protein
MNGRDRGRPQKRDDAAAWLKAYLSGGRRPMKEIERVGLEQGYSLPTLRRAKTSLKFESCTMSFSGGYQWAWRNPAVIERDAPGQKAELEEKLMHRLDEMERLGQAPKPSTSAAIPEGDKPVLSDFETEDADINQVDDFGFHTAPPQRLGLFQGKASILPMQIMKRARQLDNEGGDSKENFIKVFQWAYPNAGLSESILATMLRREFAVGLKRSEIPPLQIAQTVDVAL